MLYETKFSIGDVVYMNLGDNDPLDRLRGIVTQITINPGNLTYQVEYRMDKDIKSICVYEFQIELVEQEGRDG